MDTESARQILMAAATLFDAGFWSRIFPLLTMTLVIGGMYWMVAKAQRGDPTFRAADFLRDEQLGGKASLKRLLMAGTWAVHSQLLLVVVVASGVSPGDLVTHIGLYALVWSGTPIALQALAVWRGAPVPSGDSTPPPKGEG